MSKNPLKRLRGNTICDDTLITKKRRLTNTVSSEPLGKSEFKQREDHLRRSNRRTTQYLAELPETMVTAKKRRETIESSHEQHPKKKERAQPSSATKSTELSQPKSPKRRITHRAKPTECRNPRVKDVPKEIFPPKKIDSNEQQKSQNSQTPKAKKIEILKPPPPRSTYRRSLQLTKALALEKLQKENGLNAQNESKNTLPPAPSVENTSGKNLHQSLDQHATDQSKMGPPEKVSYRRHSQLPTTPTRNPHVDNTTDQSTMGPPGKIEYRRHSQLATTPTRNPHVDNTTDQSAMGPPGKIEYRRHSQLPTTPTHNPHYLENTTDQPTKCPPGKVSYRRHSQLPTAPTHNPHLDSTTDKPKMGTPGKIEYRRHSQLPSTTPAESSSFHNDVNLKQQTQPKDVSDDQRPSADDTQSTDLKPLNNSHTRSIQPTPKPLGNDSSNTNVSGPFVQPKISEHKTPAMENRHTPYRRPSQYMDQRYQNDVDKMQNRNSNNSSSPHTSGYGANLEPTGFQSQAPQSSEAPPSRYPHRRPSQYSSTTMDPKTFRYDYNEKPKDKTTNKNGYQSSAYTPHRRTYGPPSQFISGADLDDKYILYIRDISMEIVRRQVFEVFSSFGHLKRVYMFQRSENYKYAMILYVAEASMRRALTANPHKLNDKEYFCHKASPWHLGHFKVHCRLSETIDRTNFKDRFHMRLPYGVNIRSYLYETHISSNPRSSSADPEVENRSALLPPVSLALLHYLRKKPTVPEPEIKSNTPPKKTYAQQLFAGMGESYIFKRHSYTNFVAYQKKPGHYESVPVDYKVGLTAVAYADLRDKPELISFFYH